MISTHSSKNSGMFNRRHKGVIQTSIILILIVAVGYGFYLYNILQVKLKHMDVKEQRYLNQHQSLSSQLQVVYAERSRLEGSFQKEKNDHQNTKLELESVKESHENLMIDREKEHKKKYSNLEQELVSSQNELDGLKIDFSNQKAKHEEVINELHSQLGLLRDEASNTQELGDVLQQKKNEIIKLEENFKEAKEFQAILNLDLQKAKTEVENYNNLKSILKEVGVDVLKIDHPKLENLSAQNRMDLFAHFGGSQKHAEILESNRNQLQKEKVDREAAILRQEEQKKQQLALKQNQQNPNIVESPELNSCNLPVDVGSCNSQFSRFYFNPVASTCQQFTFTGCGGNMNNFATYQECFDKCNIGEKKEVQQQVNNPNQDLNLQNIPIQNNLEDNHINDITNIKNVEDTNEFENTKRGPENDLNINSEVFGDNHNIDNSKVNAVQQQESIARLAEEKAKIELQQQQQQHLEPQEQPKQEQQHDSVVKDLDIAQIQEKFLKNQKEIKKIDEAQFDNMDKLMQQKKEKKDDGFIEGELQGDPEGEDENMEEDHIEGEEEEVDPNDDLNEEEDLGEDLGGDDGILQDGDDAFDNGNDFEEEDQGNLNKPPAAKIAGEDDLPVLDAPFNNQNEEEKENEKYDNNYDKNNNGEEEDDYNEEDKDEEERYKAEETMDDPFDNNNEDNNEDFNGNNENFNKKKQRMREM